MKIFYKLSCIISIILITISCSSSNDNKAKPRTDTTTSGVARIVVDECLAPIIQQQVDVFEATYRDATIIPVYTSEKEAYKLLNEDSIRLVIGTRELSNSERALAKQRKQAIRSQKLAIDGIALVVNNENTDSLITVKDIRRIMLGEVSSWKKLNPESKLDKIEVVFDTSNSSTARYISDSICQGKQFSSQVKAIASDSVYAIDIVNKTPNKLVLDYVQKNKNAIGVVGVNWVSNPTDSLSLSFTRRVRVMSVSDEDIATKENSYKPYAAYLALRKYPLSRNVYIIITDIQGGLPAGFVKFAAGEIGQRIINKSGLFPATVPTRLIRVNHNKE